MSGKSSIKTPHRPNCFGSTSGTIDLEACYSYVATHNSVVSKIIQGHKQWSDEELQHYRNFPSEVERAIDFYHNGIPVSSHGSLYSSGKINLLLSYTNHLRLGTNMADVRNLNAAFLISATLVHNWQADFLEDHAIAIVLADNDITDVAVVEIGSGVFELCGIYGGQNIDLDMACDMALGLANGIHVCKSFIVGNKAFDKATQHTVNNHFGCEPCPFPVLYDLIELSAKIQESIFNGSLHDMLFLEALPMPVGITVNGGENKNSVVKVLETMTALPTKNSKVLDTEGLRFPIQISALQGDFEHPKYKLWELKNIGNFQVSVPDGDTPPKTIKVSADVDVNGILRIMAYNSTTNKRLTAQYI